jgi:hypothetical protein
MMRGAYAVDIPKNDARTSAIDDIPFADAVEEDPAEDPADMVGAAGSAVPNGSVAGTAVGGLGAAVL